MKKRSTKDLVLMLLSIVLFIVCVCVTVVLNIATRDQDIDESEIQEVSCLVTSVEKTKVKVDNSTTDFYTVYALYNGEELKVHNASGYDRFSEGSEAKLLYYRGKLYANMAGIESTTTLSYIYFGFLFGSAVMLFLMLKAISRFSGEKKSRIVN